MKKNPSRNVHFSKGPSEILDDINSSIDIDPVSYTHLTLPTTPYV